MKFYQQRDVNLVSSCLPIRGGILKPKTEKNRAKNQTETGENQTENNQTELTKTEPNQISLVWFLVSAL